MSASQLRISCLLPLLAYLRVFSGFFFGTRAWKDVFKACLKRVCEVVTEQGGGVSGVCDVSKALLGSGW